MEPLDEKELNNLLRKWEAPAAPAGLGRRLLPRSRRWWRWLFTGTIRVPVPVGFAAVALIVFWLYYSKPPAVAPINQPAGPVTFADFQPVRQLDPVLVGERK